ncbi:MAG: hypothetical protein R3195_14945 [Gemmatimonadota bacterium]|nr:hypothetical protein [Gemmatimonadota bacterium]
MARTPSTRARVVIGLIVSVAVHAAALSLVTIDIPQPGDGRIELVLVAAEPPEAETSPPIRVIEIRPPGTRLPSGGGASGETVETTARRVDPGASAVLAAVVPRPARPVRDGGLSRVALAPPAPLNPAATVVLASAPVVSSEDDDASVPRRPGRGVVLRGPGESGGAGSIGSGSAGRGIGPGTGGVTITGPGGDCITPGKALPGRTGPVAGLPLGGVARPVIGGTGRPGGGFRRP